jgi:hypothetical protein|tara:strand:+ start:202 stop:729 length:528 start_codon:yes stop_codon:yes gene_type:complete
MIKQVAPHFYRITDVFSDTVLKELQNEFNNRSKWEKQPNIQGIRLASVPNLKLQQSLKFDHLVEIKKFVESVLHCETYWNGPVLWHDPVGYVNQCHKDQSENLTVNLQVYLSDGAGTQGTHFKYKDTWYSVPYECNTGYIMFHPTKYKHGMKQESTDVRQSLYQSFRITEQETAW